MNRIAFATRNGLNSLAEGLTLFAMAGLTVAGAAAWAGSAPAPSLPQLPLVIVTGKAPTTAPSVSSTAYRLPTVVVTAKRSAAAASL